MTEGQRAASIILAGGSGGLGAATAKLLASRGFIPVIGCREQVERARHLSDAIEDRYGVRAPVVSGGVLEASTRARLIQAGADAGTLYGLVPLVGAPSRVPIETAEANDLLASARINYVAPVLLARDFAAAVGLADASIVFISTMQAIGVFPGSTPMPRPKPHWFMPPGFWPSNGEDRGEFASTSSLPESRHRAWPRRASGAGSTIPTLRRT